MFVFIWNKKSEMKILQCSIFLQFVGISGIQIAFITWVFNDQVFSSNGNGPHFRIIYYIPEVK